MKTSKQQQTFDFKIVRQFAPLLDEEDGHLDYIFYGGRDSTKSWSIAYCLITIAMRRKEKICCAKGTMVSIEDSVKELIEKRIYSMGLEEQFYITDRQITCLKTGSQFIFKGMQKTKRLKGMEGVTWCWIEEANVDTTDNTFKDFMPTIRGENAKVIMSFNPEHMDDYVWKEYVIPYMNGVVDEDSYVCKITYMNNPWLSNRSKKKIIKMRKKNYAEYQYIYGGELNNTNEDTLFSYEDINILSKEEQAVIKAAGWNQTFDKIVVAVDPATTYSDTSDACGIVVCAKYMNQKRYCIIEDATFKGRPSDWSKRAIALYNKYDAAKMVYEGNQGGLMTEDLMKTYDKFIRFERVTARQGKDIRPEPVQALYEDGKVDHFNGLGQLEGEMTTYVKDKKNQVSPNRLDAMVWGIRYLCGKGGGRMGAGSAKLY